MKAISLHQPWANWIAQGKKNIETRFWYTNYRGELLICSTKKPKYLDFPTGKAICIVTLLCCRPMILNDVQYALCNFQRGLYSWILGDIRKIDPFPVKGQQGFFEVEMPKEKNDCLF